jgi:hypothetical protein
MREHRRSKGWFPKTSELREACEVKRREAIEYRRRALVLLSLEKPHPWEECPRDDADGACVDLAAKMRELPAGLRRLMTDARKGAAEETSVPAQPETSENTAELRAALARRRERVA